MTEEKLVDKTGKLIRVGNKPEIDNLAKHKGQPDIHAVEFRDIYFAYGKGLQVLKGISLDVHRGTFTTVIGPNGSGKSTLVKILTRENRLQQNALKMWLSRAPKNGEDAAFKNGGDVRVDGEELMKIGSKALGKKIAYIPQIMEIPDGVSVYDFVSFGRIPHTGLLGIMGKHDREVVEKALRRLDIYDLRHREISKLSGGQRQKAMVALALAQESDIIILDEPTTFMDIKNQHEILDMLDELHREGKTVLAVLHDINQAAQYSDYIAVMSDGELHSFGVPEKVITEDMLEKVYGVHSNLILFEGRRYISNVRVAREGAKIPRASLPDALAGAADPTAAA